MQNILKLSVVLLNHCCSYIDSFPGTTEILDGEVGKIKNVLSNILSNRKISYFVRITSTFVARPSHPHYSQSTGFWMRHLWKQDFRCSPATIPRLCLPTTRHMHQQFLWHHQEQFCRPWNALCLVFGERREGMGRLIK